ncbi:DUF3455 domain-containing protein [Cryptosporangium minutisporangium]|uniref:DUF3455 domain-containing protein n=1 Tax=Cryptosporangium minutisporangium TaxID=113569 RepID=A0ABP6T6N5_9ACTN
MWGIGGTRRLRAVLAVAASAALAGGLAPAAAQAMQHGQAAQGTPAMQHGRAGQQNPAMQHGKRGYTLPPGTPRPSGNYRVLSVYRVVHGVQTYTCGTAGTWNAGSTPEARLVRYGRPGRIHHYAGPSWTSKRDGSTLVGALVQPTVPQPGTIPWLLLRVEAYENAPAGTELAAVTHISRVNTRGGLSPTGPCTPDERRSVRYGADYVFWVPGS